MIYDDLENASCYDLGPAFEKAVKFVRSLTPDTALGRHELDGDKMYANVMSYETNEEPASRYEFHQRYADLQAVITGSEGFFVRSGKGLAVKTEYDAKGDCGFYAPAVPAADMKMELVPGNFVLLFPQDAHMGRGSSSKGSCTLLKVVVKIDLSTLKKA